MGFTLFAGMGSYATAAELQTTPPAVETPAPPTSQLSVSSNNSLRIGYQSPVTGAFSLGAPIVGRHTVGGVGVSSAQDVSARYSTHFLGGDFGVYGGYADQPSTLALSPVSSWTFGATVGYAGVYVLGGVSDTSSFGPFIGREGWAAGLGYEIGSVDLRLTYAAQGSDVGRVSRVAESQQITLGGIYSFSSRFRLNADAFYSDYSHGTAYLSAPNAKAPQGTGARVGVQLRF
jgi:predicted porin